MKNTKRRLLAAGMCFAGCCTLPWDTQAQGVSAKAIARCAAIQADRDRLECYDLLARNSTPEATTPAAAASASPPAPPPERTFGMTKPVAPKTPEPTRMQAQVVEVSTDARGGLILRLDTDQTWELEEESATLRVNDAVVIKRAALGSFLMTTPTGRVYRVRRLR